MILPIPRSFGLASTTQSQRIRHDRYGSKAHRERCDERRQQQAESGTENACGHRHAERVVDEREAEILPHVLDCLARHSGPQDAREVYFHKRDVPGVHRDIGASPHRDPHIRLGQCGRVVDAVAGRRDSASFRLQALDKRHLAPAAPLRRSSRRWELGGHCARRRPSVAGGRDDSPVATQRPCPN